MGFSRKRTGLDGKPRYTAYYLDIRGQERSAGTFSNKKDANDAWKKPKRPVSAGKQGDPSRGRQTFETYVMEKWLPHHQLEPGVRSELRGPYPQPPAAVLRPDEDARHHARARPRVGHRHEGQGRLRPDHRVLQGLDPQRDLHHCAGRRDRQHPPQPWREDPAASRPSHGASSPPPSSTASTRRSRTPTPSCWSKPTSKAGCAGAS